MTEFVLVRNAELGVPKQVLPQERRGPRIRERRSCVRILTDDPASMKVLNPFSPSRWDVRVLDVSAQGLKLCVPEFLHPGTAIQIRLEHTIALAEVRYCLACGAEFYVGVQFQDIFPRNRPGVKI